MGCIDACGGRPDLGRLAGVGGAGNVARYCVLRSDHRNYAAKRECGRPCGCIRGGGKPDRVWPSRSCHVSFARHHLVRGRLYDDFADAFLQTRNAPDKHGVDSGADFATRYCSREAGCGAAHSGSSPVCAAGARANTEHRSQELAASVTIFSFTSSLRSWRNWQTHQLEGLALARAWWFESTRPHTYCRKACNIGLFHNCSRVAQSGLGAGGSLTESPKRGLLATLATDFGGPDRVESRLQARGKCAGLLVPTTLHRGRGVRRDRPE